MSLYQLWQRRIFGWSSLAFLLQTLSVGSAQAGAAPRDRVATEGIHVFKTDKEEAIAVMSKYTKVTDRKVLDNTYNDNKDVHDLTLWPTVTGIKSILETLSASSPKAASARPEDFIDGRLVQRLEERGFFKKLTGK